MMKSFLNSSYWEDSKLVSFFIFFFSINIMNLIILSSENINFLMIFLHLKTFFSLPLMFLFKKKWTVLIQYFIIQLIGSILVEVGYSFYYFSSEWIMIMGLFLKLGIFPFLWWYPFFLKKKKMI